MDQKPIAQKAVEEFTEAVWKAAPLGRMTLMEIVARFFEDQAVIRAAEAHGGFSYRKKAGAEEQAAPKAMVAGAK